MNYFISHVENVDAHESQFELDSDGNRIMPYTLVASRAYVMDIGETITVEDEYEGHHLYTPKTRSMTDRQSVALIAAADDYEAVFGQTLYAVDALQTVIDNHPEPDYTMLGQAWVNGNLIPCKGCLS